MNLDLDQRRGDAAHRIISDEVYQEGFRVIEERLLAQLLVVEITPERAEYLRQLLVAIRKIKGYHEQVMVTGKMADEQKGLMERMRDRIRF